LKLCCSRVELNTEGITDIEVEEEEAELKIEESYLETLLLLFEVNPL
jgi:hypothetical protein